MSDPRTAGFKNVVKKLIPGCSLSERSMSEAAFLSRHERHRVKFSNRFGTILDGGVIYVWSKTDNSTVVEFEVARFPTPISKRERAILLAFEKTQRGLFPENVSRSSETTARVASYNSFGNILISRHLRGAAAATFWTHNLIISELQELSQQRYEGDACTSGFIYTSEPRIFISKHNADRYELEVFSTPCKLDVGFFDTPTSYRYVDGKNGFYVVDNRRQLIGVLRIRNPTQFSIFDRSIGGHFADLFAIPNGRTFAAVAGSNSEVTVFQKNGLQLRWKNMFWSAVDVGILSDLLAEFGVNQDNTESIVTCVLALSDLRCGALLLVAESANRTPANAGDIGGGEISIMLREHIKAKSLRSLMNSNMAIGVLGSDGLTTVTVEGIILDAGKIIDLQNPDGEKIQGGGRTQAAIAASQYGLAIKVSEDGPISVFKKGRQLMRYWR